jgi:tetratricopeptide (TPR) repeat protein
MLPGAAREAQAGAEYFAKGRWADAHTHFLEAIRLEPNRADYYFGAAMCDWAGGQVDKAGEYLQTAVRLNPGLGTAQAWLGEWYLIQGMIDAALEATAVAMKLAPDNPAFMQSRAWVLEAAGEPDAAWALVKKLIASVQMTPSLARLYGRLAGRYGEQAQALEAINRLLGAGLAPGESSLHFTAAELLDRAGRYDEAFAMAIRANASSQGPSYDPAGQEQWVNLLIQYFTRERIRSLPKATLRSDKPVFIVGMPRSGTSLVEQILASHPSVHGAGELDFIYRVLLGTLDMLRAEMSAYPACLDNLTLAQANGMAHVYLGPFIALKPDAVRITDKMPLNFLHLGFISLFFPEARIIHCRRDPMDTCLSCFLTYFNKGHEFKRNLAHLGHFYRLYERLMAHWKNVIELPMLEVSYEEVVGDPEAQSRRLVEFLGLPWDDRCLKFHEVKRPCATASVLQVRRPIYNSSVQRWRRYERHLGPLKAALWGN